MVFHLVLIKIGILFEARPFDDLQRFLSCLQLSHRCYDFNQMSLENFSPHRFVKPRCGTFIASLGELSGLLCSIFMLGGMNRSRIPICGLTFFYFKGSILGPDSPLFLLLTPQVSFIVSVVLGRISSLLPYTLYYAGGVSVIHLSKGSRKASGSKITPQVSPHQTLCQETRL